MPRSGNSTSQVYDVLILGAGATGTTVAWKLAADGYRVCVCGDTPDLPKSFRTGHLPHQAVTLYRELGLFSKLKPLISPLDYTAHFRNGRMEEMSSDEDYAISYERLVRSLRHGLEKVATLCWSPVLRVSSTGRVKSIRLESGAVLCGWMVVVATEGGAITPALSGLEEAVLWRDHSLSFSWNMELDQPVRMSHPALLFQTTRPRHAYEHLRIFRHEDHLRGNFFTFWPPEDERRGKLLSAEPKKALAATVEGLVEYLGDFRVTSPVQETLVSLTQVHGGAEAGVILVGDACGQAAPFFEIGLCKALHDIKVLAGLAPGWLRERQITAEVLATYYTHPAKKAVDEEAAARSLTARKLATGRGAEWLARRLKGGLPDWLETACLRGVEGGRWTLDNVGIPAWRKGLKLVQTYRENKKKAGTGHRSGGVLASGHDDLSSPDGFDDLVS